MKHWCVFFLLIFSFLNMFLINTDNSHPNHCFTILLNYMSINENVKSGKITILEYFQSLVLRWVEEGRKVPIEKFIFIKTRHVDHITFKHLCNLVSFLGEIFWQVVIYWLFNRIVPFHLERMGSSHSITFLGKSP